MRLTRLKPPAHYKAVISFRERSVTRHKHNSHARFPARYCDLEKHGFLAQNYAAPRGKSDIDWH
jgi:hypothetical protein